MVCAVLRGSEVYAAQAGPTSVFIRQDKAIEALSGARRRAAARHRYDARRWKCVTRTRSCSRAIRCCWPMRVLARVRPEAVSSALDASHCGQSAGKFGKTDRQGRSHCAGGAGGAGRARSEIGRLGRSEQPPRLAATRGCHPPDRAFSPNGCSRVQPATHMWCKTARSFAWPDDPVPRQHRQPTARLRPPMGRRPPDRGSADIAAAHDARETRPAIVKRSREWLAALGISLKRSAGSLGKAGQMVAQRTSPDGTR